MSNDNGNLVLKIKEDEFITLVVGAIEIKVIYKETQGSTATMIIKAPKEVVIERSNRKRGDFANEY